MYKPFKQARNFSVHYYEHCIPKNAIYGRLTPTVYIYIKDFKSFYNDDKLARVYIMDAKSNNYFRPFLVKRDNIIFKLAYDFIHKAKIPADTKCINVLCMERGSGKPHDRAVGEYSYKARGRDNSRKYGINDDMKYREITYGGYVMGEKASMVASNVKNKSVIKNASGNIMDRHLAYKNKVQDRYSHEEIRIRKI